MNFLCFLVYLLLKIEKTYKFYHLVEFMKKKCFDTPKSKCFNTAKVYAFLVASQPLPT